LSRAAFTTVNFYIIPKAVGVRVSRLDTTFHKLLSKDPSFLGVTNETSLFFVMHKQIKGEVSNASYLSCDEGTICALVYNV